MLKVYNKLNRNQLKALEEYRTIKNTRRYVYFHCLSILYCLPDGWSFIDRSDEDEMIYVIVAQQYLTMIVVFYVFLNAYW